MPGIEETTQLQMRERGAQVECSTPFFPHVLRNYICLELLDAVWDRVKLRISPNLRIGALPRPHFRQPERGAYKN